MLFRVSRSVYQVNGGLFRSFVLKPFSLVFVEWCFASVRFCMLLVEACLLGRLKMVKSHQKKLAKTKRRTSSTPDA